MLGLNISYHTYTLIKFRGKLYCVDTEDTTGNEGQQCPHGSYMCPLDNILDMIDHILYKAEVKANNLMKMKQTVNDTQIVFDYFYINTSQLQSLDHDIGSVLTTLLGKSNPCQTSVDVMLASTGGATSPSAVDKESPSSSESDKASDEDASGNEDKGVQDEEYEGNGGATSPEITDNDGHLV